jgi:Arm DNA-binding domain
MPLTDIEIRAAKPGDRLIKLSDGGGLQLWITPDGAKRWRLAYRFAGRQKLLAVGVYPSISLREARGAGEEAKKLLTAGEDPSLAKKLAKAAKAQAAANTSDAVAAELTDKKRREGKADRTVSKLEWLLSLASPAIGARPIGEVTAAEILAALRTVESRGRHETARRLRSTIGEVFRYAVATGRAKAIQRPRS